MNISHRAQVVIATSAIAFALAACGQKEEATVGQKIDGAIASTEQAAQSVQQDVKAAANTVEREGEKATAAVVNGATDLTITTKVKTALAADDQLSALSIEVETHNGEVSLSGPAPSADAANRATVLARAVDGVTAVRNQLVVTGKS